MATESTSRSAETRDLLARHGWVRVRVDGDCMTPALRRTDRVLVRRAKRARVGDVVLLDAKGWLEIHRIVGRIDMGPRTWYVHMGDASGAWGVAGTGDLLGRVGVTDRRRLPAWRAHAQVLAYRLGALLAHLAPSLRGWNRRRTEA